MLSTSIFSADGSIYNQSAVFGRQFQLNKTALQEVGLPALTGSNAWKDLALNLGVCFWAFMIAGLSPMSGIFSRLEVFSRMSSCSGALTPWSRSSSDTMGCSQTRISKWVHWLPNQLTVADLLTFWLGIKAMKNHKEAPWWWYIILLVLSFTTG